MRKKKKNISFWQLVLDWLGDHPFFLLGVFVGVLLVLLMRYLIIIIFVISAYYLLRKEKPRRKRRKS